MPLLQGANTPEMTRYLGGPETDEKIRDRLRRYLAGWTTTTPRMFRVRLLSGLEPVGSFGYWEREWPCEEVFEAGWKILAPWPGQDLASEVVIALIARARGRRSVYTPPCLPLDRSSGIQRRLP